MKDRTRTFRFVVVCLATGALLPAAGCRREQPGEGHAAAPTTAPAAGAESKPAAGAPAAAPAPAVSLPADPKPGQAFTNSIGMKLVYIPPGEFVMGSEASEPGRHDDETPHSVRITHGFWIAATEVTQAQWRKVMGFNPAEPRGDDLPAAKLSWAQAGEFCRKLSRAEGLDYALPTEAQWEYACRAGSAGAFGDSDVQADDVAWHMDNGDDRPHAVAGKKPNAWGLYDMHGNAAEWCRDVYQRALGADSATDPDFSAGSGARVVRGGSWAHFARACRSAARASYNPAYQLDQVGLRVVIEPQAPTTSSAP